MLDAFRLAFDLDRLKFDDEFGSRVIDGKQHVAYRQHTDVQLLVQLSTCRIERAFSRLELPARKLPEATMPLVVWPPADEILVASLYHGGNDTDFRRATQSASPGFNCVPLIAL